MFSKLLKIAILSCFLIGCAFDAKTENKLAEVQNRLDGRGKLKVGYIPYFEMTSLGPTKQIPKGFLVDVFEAALARSSLDVSIDQVEFFETNWDTFGLGLDHDRFDLSIAGTFDTDDRRKAVDFTEEILSLGNGALIRSDDQRFNDVGSIDELDQIGINIAVVVGEQAYEYVTKNFSKATIQSYSGPDLSLAPMSVLRRRTDLAMSDQYVLARFVKNHPGTTQILKDKPYSILPIAWAVKKGDQEWRDYWSNLIVELHCAGEIEKILRKYPQIPFIPGRSADICSKNINHEG